VYETLRGPHRSGAAAEALVIREKVTGWLEIISTRPVYACPLTARLQQRRAINFYEKSLIVFAFRYRVHMKPSDFRFWILDSGLSRHQFLESKIANPKSKI
jgi:hypothetical protein